MPKPVPALAVKVRLYRPGVEDEMVQVDAAVPFAVRVGLVHETVRPVTEPATFTVPAQF